MELTIFYYLNFTNIYLHQHSINVCLSKYFFSQFFSKKLGEFKFKHLGPVIRTPVSASPGLILTRASFLFIKRFLSDDLQYSFKAARTYLYACWLCFWFAFFRMKESTDFYDFWHTKFNNDGTLRKCYLFSCWYKNLWNIGIYLKPHFY